MMPLDMKARLTDLLATVPTGVTPIPFVCPFCDDTGWVEIEPVPKRVRRCLDCRRDMRALVEGVPEALRATTLETLNVDAENSSAFNVVREVVEWGATAERRDVVLFGPTGTGKTTVAAAALNTLCHSRRCGGLMVRSVEMLRRLQPGTADEERATLFRQLTTRAILLVDDLGAEQATDYARRTLLEVYEARHDSGLTTFTTTNHDLNALSLLFDDDRLASRLAGWARVIPMKGADRRLRRPTRPFGARAGAA